MNIYVRNIPYETEKEELSKLFSKYGKVVRVSIPLDHITGRPRGIAFVQMGTREEGISAIKSLDGFLLGGRQLKVVRSFE